MKNNKKYYQACFRVKLTFALDRSNDLDLKIVPFDLLRLKFCKH